MPATKTQPVLGRTTLTIDVPSFRTAFAEAASIVRPRSPKPILQNVLFRVDPDGESQLIATDMEQGLRLRCLGVTASKPISIVLPTQRLGAVLRTSTDSELAFEVEEDRLTVRGLRSKYEFTTEDASLFPEVPQFDATDYVSVAPAELRQAINRTSFACDVESTRYALGGCLFEVADDSLTLVATDGRRLAQQRIGAEIEGKPKRLTSVVPQRALKILARLLDADEPSVQIALTDQAATFRTSQIVVYTRLVEGRFPRYQDVFPTEFKSKAQFEAESLLLAIEQSQITTSDESRGVDWAFDRDMLIMSSQAADVGNSSIDLPVEWQHPPLTIMFDGRYVSEALRQLEPKSSLTIDFVDDKTAAILKTEDRYAYVIMPLTRDR